MINNNPEELKALRTDSVRKTERGHLSKEQFKNKATAKHPTQTSTIKNKLIRMEI